MYLPKKSVHKDGVSKRGKRRIHILDEIRGFAVFCMVFYHMFYTMGQLFKWDFFNHLFYFFKPVEPLFAGIFIFISGISSQLSHSNAKRGLILLFISVCITLVTYFFMPSNTIWFGILHLLSVCILFFALTRKFINKIPIWLGFVINLFLFIFTYKATQGYFSFFGLIKLNLPDFLFKYNIFAPIGFFNDTFYSADYFPVLPWIFAFFCGAFIGKLSNKGKFPKFMYKQRVKFFSFLGRNALVIYVVHQPVIYAMAYSIDYAIKTL